GEIPASKGPAQRGSRWCGGGDGHDAWVVSWLTGSARLKSRLTYDAHNAAAPLLHRSRVLSEGTRPFLFQPVDLCRPRRPDSESRRLLHPRACHGKRHRHPRRVAVDSRALQRVPPPWHPNLLGVGGTLRRSDSVSVSCVELRLR